MSVTLTFTGSAHEIHEEMRSMLGLNRETAKPAEPEAQPEKPKATRSTKAKSEEPKPSPDASAQPTADASDDAAPSPTATTSSSDTPATEAELRERAVKFSQKAGPPALIEMQKRAGAPNGRISEIMGNAESMAKLDALLADAGF